MSYEAGSVTAKIILDTKEFNESINALKNEVADLKKIFNSGVGTSNVTKEVQELKKEIESLQKENKELKKTIDGLKNANKEYTDQISNLKKEIDELKTSQNGVASSTEKYQQKLKELVAAMKDYSANRNRFTQDSNRIIQSLDKEAATLEKLKTEAKLLNKEFAHLGDNFNVSDDILKLASNLDDLANKGYYKELFKSGDVPPFMKGVSVGVQQYSKMIDEASAKWKKHLEIISNTASELKAKWHAMTQELAYANAAQYKYWQQSRGSVSGFGDPLPIKGYNDYLKSINEINAALEKLNLGAIRSAEFKQSIIELGQALKIANQELGLFSTNADKTITSMSRFAKVNEVTAEITRLQQTLSHFSSLSSTNSKALSKFGEQAKILKDRLRVLETEFMEGRMAEEVYATETEKVAAQLKKLKAEVTSLIRELNLENVAINKNGEVISKNSSEYKKLESNARQAGRGITSFNNGVVQTAHSGRILSNTLYQIRGALLSLKMIFTAMGGMALWGFGMEIVEGIKTTFTAKNELEAQLKQNAKVGENGLRDFNKALDETISKFQKVNKYQLGETVSSLGVEFELSMKQMKKAMPIVAELQSEYVRAGRTSEEAALAVKDILQGEFQRLSRETGVGKEELMQYGWSGDKSDVEGILDAVKKAGDARHWDVFAAKATSLNDVLEITKNRFEEFGADLLQSISPMVVSAFNTILDVITGLQNAFNGLGSFSQNALIGGGFIAGITAIATALPMVTKGMGLAEIATLGWGKSIGTAVLNLNKAEVAQYGFRKALSAVISGTRAAELADTRWTKAIMGRILGVKQGILAQHGYLTALVKTKLETSTIGPVMSDASIASMKWYQKLGLLSGGLKEGEAASAGFGKSILKTVTSVKVLRLALLSLIAVNVVVWFASIAAWADTVKKRFDLFNDFIDNGKDKIKSAQKTLDNYNKKMGEISSSDPNYELTKKNQQIANSNLQTVKSAYKLAKQIKKNNEEVAKSNDLMLKGGLNDIYSENGLKNVEKYGQEYQQMKWLAYDAAKAEQERYNFEYASLQHIREHTDQMKEAGIEEEKRIKYITEYSAKASEAAENLKKFNQGDLTAGVYYVLNRLQLLWIDLWNDKDFLVFWDTVKRTFEDLKPTLNWLKDTLIEVGRALMGFFSTEQGRWVGVALGVGGAIGFVGYKLKGILSPLKSVWGGLKKLGGKLKDVKDGWKKVGEEAEEATDKMGGDMSTGGILEETGEKTSWKDKTIGKIKEDATTYARAAVGIAAGMLLISEAILMLQAPMGALAATGYTFKQLEPNIRQGIEGLKLIAPVMAVFLPPIIALLLIMEKYGKAIQWESMGDAFLKSAVGIAMAITLVTEAIFLLNMPMIALGTLGTIYSAMEDNVQTGIKAMDAVNQGLMALVPWVPVFAAGIVLGAMAFTGIGAVGFLAAAVGIAMGITLVTEAIFLLYAPLVAIGTLGTAFPDLTAVKQGTEAMKVTAEAMTYLSEALSALVLIDWTLIAHYIDTLIMNAMGINLSSLTEEGGFFSQLNAFVEDFNNNVNIQPIDEGKVENLKTAAGGIGAVGDALQAVKTAMENLPDEFKNPQSGKPIVSYKADTDTTTIVGSEEGTGYFDQFKKPLEELGNFVSWFNNTLSFPEDGINTGKLETISQAADMVTRVNEVVEKVKNALGNATMANINANIASTFGNPGEGISAAFGGMGAIFNLVGGTGGGSGDYQSSIGSALYEMELILKDLNTFSSNISGLGSSENGGGDSITQGLADMVTSVADAISKLESTLASAVPNIKQNASNIGTSIKDGVKEGMGDLTPIVLPPLIQALTTMKVYAGTYGKGVGFSLTEGFKSELKIKGATESEMNATLQYLDGKKQEFYDKGKALGDSLSQGYKDGQDMHSPGIIARSTFEELGRVSTYFDEAIQYIPEKAVELGNTLSSNFNPSFDLGGMSIDDLTQFQTGLDTVTSMANSTNMQTSTAFSTMNTNVSTDMQGMATNVNGAFNNINTNATTSYAKITNTTRTSLKNMQDQTTKNINNIKTSWYGMQKALIASAENIRSETTAKIKALEHNMASFWNKVQNPSLLLAGPSSMPSGRHTVPRRGGGSKALSGRLLAGRSPRVTAPSLKTRRNTSVNLKMREQLAEYLQCLLTDGFCASGGWSFNWTPKIVESFRRWSTHFGEIFDPHLNVGKFENDDFPVRGIAEVAKSYIEEQIGKTSYEHYYNYKYGGPGNPLPIWNHGSFNCVEGAEVAIGFANAFGFPGGSLRYTTWDGEGHAYAYIPGLGNIDATAIQGGYGLTASKVRYSGSKSMSRPAAKSESGTTVNIGDIHVHINGDVENAEEKGKEIADEINERIFNVLKRSDATGW